MNVAVAQNLRDSDGAVYRHERRETPAGRSFHDGKKDLSPGAVNRGYNFQEQWNRALELAPPFVMVTGWNEWTAGKFSRPGRPVVFVDQFNQEYSRDIEPVTGLHNDNYYYQLVANVRRYKGVSPSPRASAAKTIDVAGGFEQWRDVGPEFADHAFDNDHRDFGDRAGALHQRQRPQRPDRDEGSPRREERLFLREDPGADHALPGRELDVALDRRRPEPKNRLGMATISS